MNRRLPHTEPQRGVSEANRRKAAALRPEMKPYPPRRAHEPDAGRIPPPQGAPQSPLCGERRSNGMSETCRRAAGRGIWSLRRRGGE